MDRRNLLKGVMVGLPTVAGTQFVGIQRVFAQTGTAKSLVESANHLLTLEYIHWGFMDLGNRTVTLPEAERTRVYEHMKNHAKANVEALKQIITQRGGVPAAQPPVVAGTALRSLDAYNRRLYELENASTQSYLQELPNFKGDKQALQAIDTNYVTRAQHAAVMGEIIGAPVEGGVFRGHLEAALPRTQVLSTFKQNSGSAGDLAGRAAVTK